MIRLFKLPQPFVGISLFAVFCLQGCGTEGTARLSSPETNRARVHNDSTAPRVPKSGVFNQKNLEGSWIRPCKPGENFLEEKLTIKDGTFNHEMISYKSDCKDRVERFQISGSFALGAAAVDPKELTFKNGNFAIKPASTMDIRNIDFTIDEWIFDFNAPVENQDRLDLAALIDECGDVEIEKSATSLRVMRNGCQFFHLKSELFDIVSLHEGQLRLGFYISDLNTFDTAGRTTPELRSNVISNLPLIHVN
jgi:hypothetical protein